MKKNKKERTKKLTVVAACLDCGDYTPLILLFEPEMLAVVVACELRARMSIIALNGNRPIEVDVIPSFFFSV